MFDPHGRTRVSTSRSFDVKIPVFGEAKHGAAGPSSISRAPLRPSALAPGNAFRPCIVPSPGQLNLPAPLSVEIHTRLDRRLVDIPQTSYELLRPVDSVPSSVPSFLSWPVIVGKIIRV